MEARARSAQYLRGPSQLNRQFRPPRTTWDLRSTLSPGIGELEPRSTYRYSALALRAGVMAYSTPAPSVQPACVLVPLRTVTDALVIAPLTSPTARPPVT